MLTVWLANDNCAWKEISYYTPWRFEKDLAKQILKLFPMKILDILRKLWILRGGFTSGSYTSYTDMPDELMYDDVYDAKKDLVGRHWPRSNPTPQKKSEDSQNSVHGMWWFFWLCIVISLILILFLFLMMGMVVWFYLCLILWCFFIFNLLRYKNGWRTAGSILMLFFFIFCASVVFLFIAVSRGGSNKAPSGSNASISDTTDCKTLAAQYNKKVFTVSSPDGLTGEIGFSIDTNSCEYEITWHTLFHSPNIVKNVPNANAPTTSYDYIADVAYEKESSNPADWNIDPVFSNKESLPKDPFNIRVPYDFYLTKEILAGSDKTATTDTFHHVVQGTGTFSQSTIDAIFGVKKIKIHSRSAGINSQPVAVFNVTVSEK